MQQAGVSTDRSRQWWGQDRSLISAASGRGWRGHKGEEKKTLVKAFLFLRGQTISECRLCLSKLLQLAEVSLGLCWVGLPGVGHLGWCASVLVIKEPVGSRAKTIFGIMRLLCVFRASFLVVDSSVKGRKLGDVCRVSWAARQSGMPHDKYDYKRNNKAISRSQIMEESSKLLH